MSKWQEAYLGEVINFYSGGTPSKARSDYWGGGIPWVSAKDMKSFFLEDSEDHITEVGLANGTKLAPAGSVLLLTRGMTLLNNVPICVLQRPMAFNQDIKAVRPKAGICQEFVPYLLLGNKENLLNLVDLAGHGTGRLNSNDLKTLSILLPPLPEQKAIARMLSALDDKIELNRRMNETLEAMARAIFKDWFVDFGPTRAKQEGRAAYLPEYLWSLFPGAIDEQTGLPQGWWFRKFGDVVRSVSETYPLKTKSEVVFLNTGDILNGSFLHANKSNVSTLPGQAKKSIQKGDILYSEIRPQNKRFAYVYFDAPEYVVSTKLMVLRQTSDIKSLFIYFLLTHQSNIDFLQMMAESRSGTFPQITFDVVSSMDFINTSDNRLIQLFTDDFLGVVHQKTLENNLQSRTLADLRDRLLPKLMSGEIRVKEAEKMAEEVL
ncbi:restriction endonuclease subunit S [Limnothrix sp. FACHB-881]|uniref:restriction endonuclease subunit S n=1 Tax=Limnothrix sp. FACHB-881 TaxID=2692819 RepID=UPI00168987C6|nr:restriction endonuclease subunit S [Limnothrix sp. FACHB-881]MBD2635846.1 restriction endonuclease subunit S [Limnothrix sp. FACHB-881]